MSQKVAVGAILWQDLTVPDAAPIRDFYKAVVGWQSTDHQMNGYADYNMHRPGDNEVVAGICHARGSNAKVPPQWLVYIAVESVAESARRCVALGGQVLDGPRPMGAKQFCVIRDPAGAVAALIEA
jgi:predicted enzyme related to lactoylglutathione lyase